MELSQLRTFLVVAETLNFTRASERLGISPSAVSLQMSSLERELGVDLFFRAGKRLVLSPYGEHVLVYSREIFSHVNALPREVKRFRAGTKKSIRISARLRSLGSPFHDIRKKFLRISQNTELYFKSAYDLDHVITQVKTGDSDIGLVGINVKVEGLRTIPYGEYRMMPVVGQKHRLAKKADDLSLTELDKEEWALFDKESLMRRRSDQTFKENKFTPFQTYESNDGSVLLNHVVFGNGVGLLPSWAIVSEIRSGQLVELGLDLDIRIPIYLIVAESNKTRLVTAFLDFMKTKPVEGVSLSYQDSQ